MISDIEDFFDKGCGRCARFDTPECSVQRWGAGVRALREICLSAGLVETVKWGHPCYMHSGRNIAIIGAFRGDFRLTFCNAGVLSDPQGVLERQGPNTRYPDMIRFVANDGVAPRATTLRAYLEEAKSLAEKGARPAPDPREADLPDELADALDADPELAEAFLGLTPGRRKSYVIALAGAKQPETRMRRIEKFRDKIIAGKGALER